MKTILKYIFKFPYLIIGVTVVITIIFGYFAVKIDLNPDINALVPETNDRISHLEDDLGIEDKVTQYLFLSVEGDNNYTLEKLNAFSDVISSISDLPGIERVLTPFNLVTFITKGTRVIPVTMSVNGAAPGNEDDLKLFIDKLSHDYIASDFVVADKGRILTAVFTNGKIADHKSFMEKIYKIVKPLDKYFDVHITGEIPIEDRTGYYLSKDLGTLLSLSLVVMMMVFFLSFRTKRSVMLPILVVSIGTVWSVGFMSLIGYSFTIVSIIIPPLLLTIGSSYTIHLLNEYYRNSKYDTQNKFWIIEAVKEVSNTVLLAGLTTIIGFSSLLITSIGSLREFGLSISVGVAACAALSLSFLPAVFFILPNPAEKHRLVVKKGRLTRLTISFGNFSIHHPYIIIFLFIMSVFSALYLFPGIQHQSDYLSYFPAEDKVIDDTRFIIRHTGGSQTLNITLTAPEGVKNYFLQNDILEKIDTIEQQILDYPDVINLFSFTSILKEMNNSITGKMELPENRGLILMLYRYYKTIDKESYSIGSQSSLISEDGSSLTIFLKVFESRTQRFLSIQGVDKLIGDITIKMNSLLPDEVTYSLWGNALLFLESGNSLNRDQILSTLLSLSLVFLISGLYFKSYLYAFISVLPLISSLAVYFSILSIFRIPLDMTTVLVTNVAIGVGLDDAIHFLSQYLRHKKRESTVVPILLTLQRTGRPIVLTTLSLAAGMLILCFASFKPIVFFGILIAGTLFTAMLATIFILPAVLVIADKINRKI